MIDDKLLRACVGASADTPRKRAIFGLIAKAPKWGRRLQPTKKETSRAWLEEKRRRLLANKLTELLLDALIEGDASPFAEFVAGISAAKNFNTSGPKQLFHHKAFVLAEEMGFMGGEQFAVTLAEFKCQWKARYKVSLVQADSYLRRECQRLGFTFARGKVGRPTKSATNTVSL